jgi:hypothetical protein
VEKPKPEQTLAFGPVGIFGFLLLLVGTVRRSKLTAFVGLGAVLADVTVAELGGLEAMSEPRGDDSAPASE